MYLLWLALLEKVHSFVNMTTERYGCAAVSVGNKIYVFGGSYGICLSSAEVYDVTTQEWTRLPDMKEKREYCAATAVGNRIYIVGGEDEGSTYLSSCEVFDTSTNTWLSPIPDMKEKRSSCQAVTIGPKIYVMGGKNDYSCSSITSSVEVFETSTNKTIPPQEEENIKHCSHLQQMLKNDENDKPTIDTNYVVLPATQTDIICHLCALKNDPKKSSFMTAHQRVLLMEESVGLKHDSSTILIRRVEFLEMNICGENKDSGKSLTERIDNLEVSLFGKK